MSRCKSVVCVFVCVCVSCSVMSDSCEPMVCSLQSSAVPGISQSRILEWVAISFSSGFSLPGDQTHISLMAGRFFTSTPSEKPDKCYSIVNYTNEKYQWEDFNDTIILINKITINLFSIILIVINIECCQYLHAKYWVTLEKNLLQNYFTHTKLMILLMLKI